MIVLSGFIDLTGMQFTKLKVLKRADFRDKARNRILWECECQCENKTIIYVPTERLNSGNTRSCGCLRKETWSKLKLEIAKYPSERGTRIYSIWRAMINRVKNKKSKDYIDYGGRGITVCNEWIGDYYIFKNWALENGYRDDLSIDRIDVNGNYEPLNCKWSTNIEQANNKRNNVILTYNGLSMNLAQWTEYLGINKNVLSKRLKRGWSIEKTLTTPVKSEDVIILTYNDMSKTFNEWSDYLDIKAYTLRRRYYDGWSVKEILTTHVGENRIQKEKLSERKG